MATINLAWYNLENLFEPGQHPEYGRSWTENRYNRKVQHLASVIADLHGGEGPDLLGVCEVQSERVLDDLIAALPNSGAYAVAHADSPDVRMIDVGFIYRPHVLSFVDATPYNIRKRYPTRDVLDVTFRVNANDVRLHAVGNHWPSRSGGHYASEPYRILVAENVAWIVDGHYQEDPDANVVLMGDFNDDPFSRSVLEYLYAIRNKERVQARRNSRTSRPYTYNLSWPLMHQSTPGSYHYSSEPDAWLMFDQIMVSKGLLTGRNGLEVRDESMAIHRPPHIRQGAKPFKFRRKSDGSWWEGYSDHFPVTAVIDILE